MKNKNACYILTPGTGKRLCTFLCAAAGTGMSQLHLRLVIGRSPVSSFCFDSSGSKVTLSCGITFSLPSRQCRMGLRRDLGNGLWTLSGGLS